MTGFVYLQIKKSHEIKLFENIIKMYNSPFFAIDFNFLDKEKSLKNNFVILNITPMLIDLNEEQIKEKIKDIKYELNALLDNLGVRHFQTQK
jgi:hypothetical protein